MHRGCTDTVREFALKAGLGGKSFAALSLFVVFCLMLCQLSHPAVGTSPIEQRTLYRTSPIEQRTLYRTSPIEQRTLYRASPIEQRTLYRASPIEQRTLYRTSPIEQRTLYRTSPIEQRTLYSIVTRGACFVFPAASAINSLNPYQRIWPSEAVQHWTCIASCDLMRCQHF